MRTEGRAAAGVSCKPASGLRESVFPSAAACGCAAMGRGEAGISVWRLTSCLWRTGRERKAARRSSFQTASGAGYAAMDGECPATLPNGQAFIPATLPTGLSSIPAFVMRRVFRKKPDGRSWSRRRVPAGAWASLRHAAEQAGGAGMPSCREFQIAARSVKAVRRRRATMQRGFGRAAVLPVRRLAAGFPWQRRVRRCRCQGTAGAWGCRQPGRSGDTASGNAGQACAHDTDRQAGARLQESVLSGVRGVKRAGRRRAARTASARATCR